MDASQSMDAEVLHVASMAQELAKTAAEQFEDEMVLVKKSRCFACPFYILNNNYAKCVTRHHLYTIEEVKEHLCCDHRRPVYCPICKEEFSLGRNRDAHIRLRACHANNSTNPEGITYEQEERLERVDRESLSEDLRWFHIWDVIFPDVERPSSAFYVGDREVSVCAFRQFWMQNGEETVTGFLEQRGYQDYGIRSEDMRRS
ncbi:hypothetical protein F5883DRAFT_570130 [Diaporthe sp. PMI_573]|nr:hypothetical protein F5883DRAFT_570130 [Diaporthaceae sp. PMI_573]